MDSFGQTLLWFQEGDKKLEVPFFQRPYVWDEDNWLTLVSNIKDAKSNKMPFIGSFILQKKTDDCYWVIDGQQRITTLTILIKSFLDADNSIIEFTRSYLKGILYSARIIDGLHIEFVPRLIPSNADKESYDKVMDTNLDRSILKAGESKIVDCYLYFYKYFCELNSADRTIILNRLISSTKYVIIIALDAEDDEQEIFDTVNSLGKKLTNSDIVKNYLYQKMKAFADKDKDKTNNVLKHYDQYWNKKFIENDKKDFWDRVITLGRIATTNLDAFLKDYATIKGIYIPSESGGIEGLAKKYKDYIDLLSFEQLKSFSIELSEYADVYYDMKNNYENCDRFLMSDIVNTTLLVLDVLETSTFNPYILSLIKNKDKDIDEKLFALQKFVLKRYLWKATAKNYNKVCLSLLSHSESDEYLDNYNDQSEDVDWESYPNAVKNIKKNKHANLLLFLIEMIRRKNYGENKYSDSLLFNKTLEHIMPQKWEKNWKGVPSYFENSDGDYEEIIGDEELITKNRNSKVYSLGNMTLLSAGLNTSISNGTFETKINGTSRYKGMKTFGLSLSVCQEVVDVYNDIKRWDERNIIKREKDLTKELNKFYKFVPDDVIESACENNSGIKRAFDDKDKNQLDNKDFNVLDKNSWENVPITTLAKEVFVYLINNKKISDDIADNLLDLGYCKNVFHASYPVFAYDRDANKLNTDKKHYGKTSYLVGAKTIYLSFEWFANQYVYLREWLISNFDIFKE